MIIYLKLSIKTEFGRSYLYKNIMDCPYDLSFGQNTNVKFILYFRFENTTNCKSLTLS